MKMKCFGLLLATAFVAFSVAGCGSSMQARKEEAPRPKGPEETKLTVPEEKMLLPVPPPAPPAARPPAAEAAAGLNNIYFDFNRYDIRPGDAEKLKKNLTWFRANASTTIRIEGTCDERGTVEYNLALGQKRAESAKKYLVGLGIDAKQLETISYGKEKPVCIEHNEGCWAQNRRDAFVLIR
jgi:peptidoglycan-associated lipoprotein